MDWKGLRRCVKLAKRLEFALKDPELSKKAQELLLRDLEKLTSSGNPDIMKRVINFLNMAEDLQLELDLWKCQNMFYDLYHDPHLTRRLSPKASSTFHALGKRLGFRLGED
jgi:hypothetical protein